MRRVYLDHSATTPVRPEVLEAMLPYFKEKFGNPSSIHAWGREIRSDVEAAREKVASLIGAEAREIVFTAGGSESDNTAIFGAALAAKPGRRHVVTSAVEHHAVLDTVKALKARGYDVTFVPVDEHGMVHPEAVREAVRDDTFLVSIMHANNEVGTIMPIKEIAEIAHERGALMHTDAVQTVGHIPFNVQELGVDLASMSAHKFYGPKGVGVLYIRKGVKLEPLIYGGGQERKRRAGTENVAGIVGLATALELAVAEMPEESERLAALRDRLIEGIRSKVDHVKLNGHPTMRLPGHVNMSFKFVEGEALLLNLDLKGIAASSGSACTSGSLEPSHVLLAMGIPHEVAHGSVRMTMGRATEAEDVDYVLEVLPPIVEKLRAMSPLAADFAAQAAAQALCGKPAS